MSELLKKIKSVALAASAVVCIAVLVGGCVSIDYGIYQRKYPNTDFGDYIWNAIFGTK